MKHLFTIFYIFLLSLKASTQLMNKVDSTIWTLKVELINPYSPKPLAFEGLKFKVLESDYKLPLYFIHIIDISSLPNFEVSTSTFKIKGYLNFRNVEVYYFNCWGPRSRTESRYYFTPIFWGKSF